VEHGLTTDVEQLHRGDRTGTCVLLGGRPLQVPVLHQQLPNQLRVALAQGVRQAIQAGEQALRGNEWLGQPIRLAQLQDMGIQSIEVVKGRAQSARIEGCTCGLK
jgi:hypothetical protein